MFFLLLFLVLLVPWVYQFVYYLLLKKDGITQDEADKLDRLMRLAFSLQMAILGALLITCGHGMFQGSTPFEKLKNDSYSGNRK